MKRKRFSLVAAVAALIVSTSACGLLDATFDPKVDLLEKTAGEQVGVDVTIVCPESIPLGAGTITDCTITDGVDRKILRLTQDDDEGHYRYELTTQNAD